MFTEWTHPHNPHPHQKGNITKPPPRKPPQLPSPSLPHPKENHSPDFEDFVSPVLNFTYVRLCSWPSSSIWVFQLNMLLSYPYCLTPLGFLLSVSIQFPLREHSATCLPSADGHLGCFHLGAVINRAAVSIFLHVFCWTYARTSVGNRPKNEPVAS